MMDIDKWLKESLKKVKDTPPEQLISELEQYGLVKPKSDPMQELVELTEELGLYDETK